MAWGLQQYRGNPFIVRVYTSEQEAAPAPPRAPTVERRPAAKANAVSHIVRTVRKVAEEDFKRQAGTLRKAAAH
jgi:hypothetical protein